MKPTFNHRETRKTEKRKNIQHLISTQSNVMNTYICMCGGDEKVPVTGQHISILWSSKKKKIIPLPQALHFFLFLVLFF